MFRKVFRLQVTVFSILFFLFTVTLPFGGPLPTAYAADEFGTSYDVVYDVGDDGETLVTEKITLRNLTSQYYADQFKLTIGATDISDVKASDPSGPMEVSTEQKDTSTTISVKFNAQVAGLGKTLSWTLSFRSKDFAQKMGKVWEVRAPKIFSTQNLESYNLTISTPLDFGQPSLISPNPKTQTISSGKLFLTFDKNQIQSSGVSANFGIIQIFDFDLSYHIENNNIFPILTNIALPPDTQYQDIILQKINPQPINVTIDDDGNYLAWYRLTRGQKLDIKVLGSVKLYTNSKVKDPSLEKSLYQKYLSSQKYWEKDNPAITSKLAEIFGDKPLSDNREKVKLIYYYVVNSLKYNSSRLNGNIERFGAVTALNNPDKAVCMEFTDLFIALTRAAGIPARELDGFAYTQNSKLRPLSLSGGTNRTKDILHSWPEYWDEVRGWVMVDPTWENTTGGVDYFNKLDLNHFTFVIKGLSSEEPNPAGSYKYIGTDSRDVKVSLSDQDFLGKAQLDVKIETSDPIISGLPSKIKVKISNLGNGLFQSAPLVLLANKLTILEESKKLGPIPPFGTAEFEFKIRTKSLFEKFNDQITLLLGGQKYEKNIEVKPLFLFQPISIAIAGWIFIIILIYFAVLVGVIYRKRFKIAPKKK